MEENHNKTSTVSTFWNPFGIVKGRAGLILGLIVILIGSIGSIVGNVRYSGILSWEYFDQVHWISGFLDQILGLILSLIVFYTIAYVFGARKIHTINLCVVLMVARAPLVVLPFLNFNGWLFEVSEGLLEIGLEGEHLPAFGESVVMVLVSILLLFCFVWSVSLLFNGYRSSTRLRGIPSLVSFIVAVVLSLMVSGWIIPDQYFF